MAITKDDSAPTTRRGGGGSFSSRTRGGGGSFAPTSGRLGRTAAATSGVSNVAPPPAAAPPSYDGGGGGGGGGIAPMAVAAPPAPTPMRDVDWFESDSIYRGQAGRNLTDLTSQLAQILADRDAGYQQLDMSRGELTRGRQEDLTDLGNDFAGRGLSASGLFAQTDDRVQADYARQGAALDQSGNRLAQQFGSRDSIVNLDPLRQGNTASLSSIYGLLGAMGMNAGQGYNSAMSRARAESAQRATAPLIQTTNW